jgi:hypothetical protein
MKSYWIDEISASDMEKIREELKGISTRSGIEALYWVAIPDDLLGENQLSHLGCKPHVFALELGPDWIRLELFVRNLTRMSCACNAYFTPSQVQFAVNFADRMLERLCVRT